MSSLGAISKQQKLMASWCGRPIDEHGLVRILNENGTRPPLLWIFNAANGPKKLAEALGNDQPLIFTRSTHLMVQPGEDPAEPQRELADHFLHQVALNFPGTKFDFGTSCQGTGIVMHFCAELSGVNIDVGALCMINCSMAQEITNRPAMLVYGDNDRKQDPFESDFLNSERRANTMFSTYRRLVVPARHGTYFSKGVIEGILAQFAAFKLSVDRDRVSSSAASSSDVG